MIFFDVKSLFTNIPIDFVIDQILEKSFPDKKTLLSWSGQTNDFLLLI